MRPGFIACRVEVQAGCLWLVSFPSDANRILPLQPDIDRASFANACGRCPDASPLSQAFIDLDPTLIDECPSEYLDVAYERHDPHDDRFAR